MLISSGVTIIWCMLWSSSWLSMEWSGPDMCDSISSSESWSYERNVSNLMSASFLISMNLTLESDRSVRWIVLVRSVRVGEWSCISTCPTGIAEGAGGSGGKSSVSTPN